VRWTLVFLCATGCASGLLAQGGTDPKPKADDYEEHGQARSAAIGAEFMIHSFSGQGVTYLAPDYLVVEVALYPAKGTEIEVRAGAFALRLNGKKAAILPAAVTMVATDLQHPEWRDSPGLQVGAGTAEGGVVLGAPRQTPVPGQPRSGTPTGTPMPGSDEDPIGGGAPRAPRVTAQDLLMATALPEGKHHTAVSGYLYFPYRGKAGSLKTVELLFEDAVVKLR
jgi:hypothetical protein